MKPAVSVIVPAHNAAATLAETLESLQKQTFPRWEAIVVNDGSSDSTAEIAGAFAELDPRIRLISQEQRGEGGARNTGIGDATSPWLLFLDSDDWLEPTTLAVLYRTAVADSGLDAVHCGWARVAPDGTHLPDEYCGLAGKLFPAFARYSALAIHACLIRRSRALEVGGFEPGLRTGADWDFWQRFSRLGTRFGTVNQSLARYRLRAGSASTQAELMLRDGLKILERGHSPDPRVRRPDPEFANGLPHQDLPALQLGWLCWPAGLMIGRGEDPRVLFREVPDIRCSGLAPYDLAMTLLRSVALSHCRSLDVWQSLWPKVENRLQTFLDALEDHSGTWRLSRRILRCMERMQFEECQAPHPALFGQTYGINVDISAGVGALAVPEGARYLHCAVERSGQRQGQIELPLELGDVSGETVQKRIDDLYGALSDTAITAPRRSLRAGLIRRSRSLAIGALRQGARLPGVGSAGHRLREWLPVRLAESLSASPGLPILMYHRVAPSGSERTARYRITPEAFEEQLRFLRHSGFRGARLESWAQGSTPPTRGSVVLTFDDAFADFADYAWPLLKKYGFEAYVFVVTGHAGGVNAWDKEFGESIPLLGWQRIRDLARDGCRFGSHAETHRPLTGLSPAEIVEEAEASRTAMVEHLGEAPRVVAYPHGDSDPIVQYLFEKAGYELGLSCIPGRAQTHSPRLQLPRIEITGFDTLDTFRRKLRAW